MDIYIFFKQTRDKKKNIKSLKKKVINPIKISLISSPKPWSSCCWLPFLCSPSSPVFLPPDEEYCRKRVGRSGGVVEEPSGPSAISYLTEL
jgi:hypothetical protein